MGERRPEDEKLSPRNVLSRDEIRELLSPLRCDNPDDRPPVLILTDRPEDAESIAKTLKSCDVSHVSASHRFAALDWFRQRRYSAVVASTRSLLIEAQGFVERLREVDPEIVIYLICDANEDPLIEGVELIHRPLTEPRLRELAMGVAPDAVSEVALHEPLDSDPAVTGGSASGRPAAPTVTPRPTSTLPPAGVSDEPVIAECATAGEAVTHEAVTHEAVTHEAVTHEAVTHEAVTHEGVNRAKIESTSRGVRDEWQHLPDPFAAIQCMTEARLAGGDLEAGLRRWVHEDDNVSGLAVLTLETPTDLEAAGTIGLGSSAYCCRAIATSVEVREEILRAAGAELGESVFESDAALVVRSQFLVFSEPGRPRTRWGVFAPRLYDATESAGRIADGIRRCLPQLRRIRVERVGSRPDRGDVADRGSASPGGEPPFGGEAGALIRSIHDRLDGLEERLR